MSIEKTYSLRAAARAVGVSRGALRKWFLRELGLALPEVPHGSRAVIRESDLERLLQRRGMQVRWDLLRRRSA